MGCSDCGSKGGCDARKHVQRAVLDAAIDRVYPDRTWGLLDDEARFGAGVRRREAQRLGRAMAEVLRAPTFFRAGGEDDLCDFIYVLCLGRAPALIEVREGRGEPESAHIEERYLRVCLSSVARLGAVQEVELTLDDGPEGAVVTEAPRAGVFDPTLLQAHAQAHGAARGVGHLAHRLRPARQAAEPSAPGEYVDRFGVPPKLANFLFYADPPTTASITVVPR